MDFLFNHCCWWHLVLLFALILLAISSYYFWCKENYHPDPNLALCSIGAKISIGKTRLCGPKDRINDPLTIISGKPVLPGDALCYGPENGEFYIRLRGPAILSAITYEHISKESHPDGYIQSAPSTFLVFELATDPSSGRHNEIFLGKFEYLDNGHPIQSFVLKGSVFSNQEVETEFSEVKIHVVSNHGNPDFTCIYRIAVHGKEKKVQCENKVSPDLNKCIA